jgi:hypothetical protein
MQRQEFIPEGGFLKLMLTGIRIIGLGIWVAILSMAIAAFFFRHGTEEDVTLVFVAILDFIVIVVAARAVLRMCHKKQN